MGQPNAVTINTPLIEANSHQTIAADIRTCLASDLTPWLIRSERADTNDPYVENCDVTLPADTSQT